MKFVIRLVNAFCLFSHYSSAETFATLQRKYRPLLTYQTLDNQKLDNVKFKKLIEPLEPIDLKLGMKELQVGRLQLILKHYSYYSGSVDDYFGYKTQLAISNLQQDLGLEDSGELDGATWYAINFWLPLEKSIA